jgi:ABC-type branched-subunit amino acid transport system substrate-binding protein
VKKRYLLAGMLALVIVVALLAVACGGGDEETTTTLGAATGEPIKIGFICDLTGLEATTGLNMQKSLELAFDAIGNRIGDRPVEIIAEDAADNPATAVDKARKLVEQDKVVAIFGPNEAGEKFAVSDYMKNAGHIPLILFSPAPDPLLKSGNPWLVAAMGTNSQQPSVMADYAYNDLGYRKVNTLGQEGAGGKGFLMPFIGTFTALGGTVNADGQVWPPAGTSDFGPFLTTLPDADALVAWMPGDGIGMFIQYVKMGIIDKMPIVGAFHGATFDPWVYAKIAENNPDVAEAIAGAPTPMEYSPELDSAMNQEFIAEAKAAWGDNVVLDGSNVNPYQSAELFIKALEANGGVTTPDELLTALLGTRWDGPQGEYFFAEGSQAATIPVYIVKEVKGTAADQFPYHYVTVKTYDAVPPGGLVVGTTATTAAGAATTTTAK